MSGPYPRLFRTAGYPLPLALGLVAALPLGMVELALLLSAEQRSGSLTHAGLVPAAFGIGNAFGLVVQGPLIDRVGQTRVLVPASLVCSAALLAAVVPPWSHETVLLALACVAGGAFPATVGSMRVLTAELVREPELRTAGYALLAVSFGLVMVIGPLLVSAIITVADAATAVVVGALVIGGGGLGFALTPASRHWRPVDRRGRQGSTVSPGLVTLVTDNTLGGFSRGLVAIALPAAVLAQDRPAVAGVGFAGISVGTIVGTFVYGGLGGRGQGGGRGGHGASGRHGGHGSRITQLLVSLGAAAAAGWLSTAVTSWLPALFVVLLLGGVVGSVAVVVSSAILDDVAVEGALTTSYTVMVGLSLVAQALGTAAGGALADHLGTAWAFAAAAAARTGAAGWTVLRRHTLRARVGV